MSDSPASWLLLIVSVPTDGASTRMRIWRSVKASGCAALRDGAYLLPDVGDHRYALQQLLAEAEREGGSGWLLTVTPAPRDLPRLQALFDRAGDYRGFVAALEEARNGLAALAPPERQRQLRKLRKDFDALRGLDFFPNDASRQAEAAWLDLVHLAETLTSSGEPQAVEGGIPRRDRARYQGRTWATRRGLWVDRVASAWLIRRFIDPEARFLWLADTTQCPPDALGFDFDRAGFTHVGERVTFEVLLASFGLDADPALCRLGAMVHALDVGGAFVPEAAGFEAMLSGARRRAKHDDALLADMSHVLDAMHAHFSAAAPAGLEE
ncbi:MAG: chromate resistance protein ChrB domain-containing protein [Telluria sp.]